MRRFCYATAALALTSVVFLAPSAPAADAAVVNGVWRVAHVNFRGRDFDTTEPDLLLFTDGYYAAVSVRGEGEWEPLPQNPTDEERLASLDRFFANAGTYEVAGDEIRMKIIVAKSSRATAEQPENVATFELQGDDTLIITYSSGAVLTFDRLE